MTVKQHEQDSGNAAASSGNAAEAPSKTPVLPVRELTDVERGLVVGILIGEGHFGGDGRQPQVTLRMHTRHEALFRWLVALFPRTRLYGPYHHGGRHYYQWMARGAALVEDVLPVVEEVLTDEIDSRTAERVRDMKARYAGFFTTDDQ